MFRKNPSEQIHKTLFELRFKAKSLHKSADQSRRNEKKYAKKVKKAIAANDENTAKLYARQAVQHRDMALRIVSTACRLEMIESRTKLALESGDISENVRDMLKQVSYLVEPLRTMDKLEQVEGLFDDIEVATRAVEGALDNVVAPEVGAAPAENEILEWARDSLAQEHQQSNTRLPRILRNTEVNDDSIHL